MRGAKSLFKSKTFYFGVLSIILAIANILGFADYQPESWVNEAVEIVNGVGIIVLRIVTKNPVKVK